MRRRVQEHVGRLPVAYYDGNKTGTLVWRIMADVEGIRNLIGTGLVEFAGGLLTSAISLVVLFRISSTMTILAFSFLLVTGIALQMAFGTIRPIFNERSKIYAEVTGRLTESLGGVRVVKGYHAEAREANVFSAGVQRLLDNVLKTLSATSVMSLSSTVLLGVVGATVMYVGTRQILAGTLTLGGFFTYTLFLGFLVAPVFQIVSIGTQLTEALAGLERTREVLRERPEDEDPKRTVSAGVDRGPRLVRGRPLRLRGGEGRAPGRHVRGRARHRDGSGRAVGVGEVDDHQPRGRVRGPEPRAVLVDGVDLATIRLDAYRTALGVVLQESFLFDGTIRENVAFSRPDATRSSHGRVPRRAGGRVRRTVRGDVRHRRRRARREALGGQRQRVSIAGRCSRTRGSSSSTRRRPASTPSRRRSSRPGSGS